MICLRNILFWFLFCKFVNLQKADIKKSRNGTSISCISEENVNSAMFINPPLPEITESTESLMRQFILKSDWAKVTSEESQTEAIFDKRWESFQLDFTNEFVFDECKTISFSMYGGNKLLFGLRCENDNNYELNVNVTLKQQWTSFTIFCKKEDRKIYFFQNNELFRTIENKVVTQLKIRVNKQTYFKIHNYNFLQSLTKSKKPTIQRILPRTHVIYLGLYFSLCSWCGLDFTSNNQNVTLLSTKKQKNLLEKWQYYYMEIDPNEYLNITFERTVTQDQENGFWGLDVRLYTNSPNIVSYRTTSDLEDFECNFLNDSNFEKNSTILNHLKKCQPEELNINCDINFTDILEKNESCCETYNICKKKDCFCGRERNKNECNNTCSKSRWGSNCQNYCQDCDNYKEKETNQEKEEKDRESKQEKTEKDTDKTEKSNSRYTKDSMIDIPKDNAVVFWIVVILISITIILWVVFFTWNLWNACSVWYSKITKTYTDEDVETVSSQPLVLISSGNH